MGSKGQKSTFSEHGHNANQIKRNLVCIDVEANILPAVPPSLQLPPDPGYRVISSHFFSKHGHVVYQIKWNHYCSNMVANILHAYPSPNPEVGSLGQNLTF